MDSSQESFSRRAARRRNAERQGIRSWRLAVVLSLSVLCLVVILALLRHPQKTSGPLAYNGDTTVVGIPIDPNTPFTFGLITLSNGGLETATLESVALLDPSPEETRQKCPRNPIGVGHVFAE
jgi:hypothetical protein